MRLFTTFVAISVAVSVAVASAGATERETAIEVDRLLMQHFQAVGVSPAPLVKDEDFLRRVYLDLAGTVPSPRDVTLFGLNISSEKRSAVVDELLESAEFAETWARYWGDVVFLRATEARSRLAQPAFQTWMQEQLAENRPWHAITRDLITATGPVLEEGATGLIFAHTGQPDELAAEVSRIFLGIQMSCANCHDHPTDAWTREQFHQLAAFFPRISVRQEAPGEFRSFAVRSVAASRGRRSPQNVGPEQLFRMFDRNGDGQISREEASRSRLAPRFDQLLAIADKDRDGKLSLEEFSAVQMTAPVRPGQGTGEHYMPDLDNPAARGSLMQPVFFVPEVEGRSPRPGADDLDRRNALAGFITSPSNPWFARAFVNRVWAELLGQGFYMPIDDIGPERLPLFEDVLDLLSDRFVSSGYDVKWLYRTISGTEAYQRQLATSGPDAGLVPFAAAAPMRLRADQVYQSIETILGAPPTSFGRFGFRGRDRGRMPGAGGLGRERAAFSSLFGFDPSTPQEDLLGTVPQALFLMNSPRIETLIRGSGGTRLSRLLRIQDDGDALHELYLLVLSRPPTENELTINREYVHEVGERTEAFEDILWSLMNSTEFLSKR